MNVCLLFGRLQLYREMYVVVMPFLASHIDTTVLADGTYKLIPESEGGDHEAQVNTAVLTEAPDIIHISNYYHLSLLLTCAFTVLRI